MVKLVISRGIKPLRSILYIVWLIAVLKIVMFEGDTNCANFVKVAI